MTWDSTQPYIAGTREQERSFLHSEILPAIDYGISAVETICRASQTRKKIDMEAASNSQDELERIEKQIQQLEDAPGDNQQARHQLQELHGRVDALRRQMAGQLTPWERTELARHPMRPYPLDYIERLFSA